MRDLKLPIIRARRKGTSGLLSKFIPTKTKLTLRSPIYHVLEIHPIDGVYSTEFHAPWPRKHNCGVDICELLSAHQYGPMVRFYSFDAVGTAG